ncbi:MAG: hypothetical protein ONB11_12090 [candidate division KSB1 bacterium]|nr:hypothetical protein [candidate division KSB1 bacterium]
MSTEKTDASASQNGGDDVTYESMKNYLEKNFVQFIGDSNECVFPLPDVAIALDMPLQNISMRKPKFTLIKRPGTNRKYHALSVDEIVRLVSKRRVENLRALFENFSTKIFDFGDKTKLATERQIYTCLLAIFSSLQLTNDKLLEQKLVRMTGVAENSGIFRSEDRHIELARNVLTILNLSLSMIGKKLIVEADRNKITLQLVDSDQMHDSDKSLKINEIDSVRIVGKI